MHRISFDNSNVRLSSLKLELKVEFIILPGYNIRRLHDKHVYLHRSFQYLYNLALSILIYFLFASDLGICRKCNFPFQKTLGK